MRMPIVLAGPRARTTLVPRAYEVTVHDPFGDVCRRVRARRPEDALRDVQIGLDYGERVDLTSLPATVRRLGTGEVWHSPGSPSPS